MTDPSAIPTPECDKALAHKEGIQVLSEFLEFLSDTRRHIGRFNTEGRLDSERPESLISEFFDLDEDEMEREKRALLEAIRQQP